MNEFMKQIRTVKHSFKTTGTENYRVQLAVPPSTLQLIIIIIIVMLVFKKLANKYTKN